MVNEYVLQLYFCSLPNFQHWTLFCVHGAIDCALYNECWSYIDTLVREKTLPWVIIGDLNELLDSSDKGRGKLFRDMISNILKNRVFSKGLVYLGYAGNLFTWSN